jgi:FtsH-binding integral membrane protein
MELLVCPQVYFGLLIFLGYMVYDTQEIIERAHRGDMDYIKHALTLFTDFIAVLVRIIIIMVRTQATFAAYSLSSHLVTTICGPC